MTILQDKQQAFVLRLYHGCFEIPGVLSRKLMLPQEFLTTGDIQATRLSEL